MPSTRRAEATVRRSGTSSAPVTSTSTRCQVGAVNDVRNGPIHVANVSDTTPLLPFDIRPPGQCPERLTDILWHANPSADHIGFNGRHYSKIAKAKLSLSCKPPVCAAAQLELTRFGGAWAPSTPRPGRRSGDGRAVRIPARHKSF